MVAQPAAKILSLTSKAPLFTPNLTAAHSVVLDHPLDTVFAMLATSPYLERVVRLSDLCSEFVLLELDKVVPPDGKPLAETRVRAVPPSSDGLPRQSFWFIEAVPILFGLLTQHVLIAGCSTWDPDTHVALYETSADAGILIRKLRTFEALAEGTKTRVSETIEGRAPLLLRGIVEKECRRAHKAHMDSYHTLF